MRTIDPQEELEKNQQSNFLGGSIGASLATAQVGSTIYDFNGQLFTVVLENVV